MKIRLATIQVFRYPNRGTMGRQSSTHGAVRRMGTPSKMASTSPGPIVIPNTWVSPRMPRAYLRQKGKVAPRTNQMYSLARSAPKNQRKGTLEKTIFSASISPTSSSSSLSGASRTPIIEII